VGLFFYAGHGLQVSGRNYLVPIDAELKGAEALDFEMIGLDVVQRIMEAATETNIQPGNVALDGTGSRNSPYAAALVKHIATQAKDLPAILVQVRRDVMATTGKRQIPWEHSALTAEVMLAPHVSPQKTAIAAAPAAVPENAAETNIAAPESVAAEEKGGCAAENPAKGFIADFEKLKRAYSAKLIDSLEYERRRSDLADRAFQEIQRGPNSEDCVLQKLKHLSDLYQRQILDSLQYPKFKDQLSKAYFQ
jgi:uncharacterized caspase-like protein